MTISEKPFYESPAWSWLSGLRHLRGYGVRDLLGDATAGLVVAVMLVPQAMGYAVLAGLPPQVGLYASITPVFLYALFGSSRYLAVGPVAVVSLMVAHTIGPLAGGDPGRAMYLAVTLALLVGTIQVSMGLLRLGFLVNFLSHPVLSGFTSAAAVAIGLSQADQLLGLRVPRAERAWETAAGIASHIEEINPVATLIGLLSIVSLLVYRPLTQAAMEKVKAPASAIAAISRCGPLIVTAAAAFIVWGLDLGDGFGVRVVGAVPSGFPSLGFPTIALSDLGELISTSLAIALVGFLEGFAISQSLASRHRERARANQELLALGLANLSAGLSRGYPVAGGFSRSVVNYDAGARSGVAQIVTAVLLTMTLLFITPALFYIPKATLAAVVTVAVVRLVDLKAARRIWAYSKADGACLMVTALCALALGLEAGVGAGAVLSVALFFWRTSRPHLAVVGRVGETEHYRNVLRHHVKTHPEILALRIDESLYFANVRGLEEKLLRLVSENPAVRHVLLVGSGINFIDASGLECLEACRAHLATANVSLNLAEFKGPVTDELARVGFLKELGENHMFLSTHEAMTALSARSPAKVEGSRLDSAQPP